MKIGPRVLQISALFPPVLAILVGLSLYFRAREEDRVSRRLWLNEIIFSEASQLQTACHEFILNPDETTRRQWKVSYDALGRRGIARLAETSLAREQTIVESIRSSYKSVGETFEKLSRDAKREDWRGDSSAEYWREINDRLQSITSGALQLAQASHLDTVATQRMTDSIIIILGSLIALAMAGSAYLAVRAEIARRGKVDEELRKSDIKLSDAFLKLRRATDQVAQTERLLSLEQVARNIIHSWKNAMVPIVASIQYLPELVEDEATKKEMKEMLGAMENAVGKADQEVNRLNDLTIKDAQSSRAAVDLNNVVEEALLLTRERWEHQPDWARIEVVKDFTKTPVIRANSADLREAVRILIVNATEAMPKGGTLTIRTKCAGLWVGMELSDTGIGMSEDIRKRCLEPFFSTKGSASAGMGLTTVQNTIRQLHGTIDIESSPGRGTTVALCLPVEATSQSASKAETAVPYKAGPTCRVLVIDDESWSRVMLVHALTSDGHSVETANDGADGLTKFRVGKFGLVVTDHAMPDMTGEEVAAEIKRFRPGTPVILVTGYRDHARSHKSPHAGTIDAVIDKPIQPASLREAIAQVMPAGR